MNETADLLTLALLPGLSPRAGRELLARGPLADTLARPDEHADLLPAAALEALRAGATRRDAQEQLRQAARTGARVVGLDEPDYPALLRRIYDPPPVLFARGELRAEEPAPVAIVGARAASAAGRAWARRAGRDLAGAGATVVSGLARGVDGEAHAGALEASGRTLAVLGAGLDRLYPPEHADLASRLVAAGGALVTEFGFATPPRPHHFPRRNRVIAGLSRAVVVVEASSRSGALGTARCAADEGRDVLAVPGHPSHPGAAGVNRLLRDGAVLVRDARDVAEELGLPLATDPATVPSDRVLAALGTDTPRSLDEILARCGGPPSDLLARLGELEIESRVRRLPGALYVRS